MKTSVGHAAALTVAALVVWVISLWLRVSSGLSTALSHPTRPGEVMGSWGEALATVAFVAGAALLVVARRRRRHGER